MADGADDGAATIIGDLPGLTDRPTANTFGPKRYTTGEGDEDDRRAVRVADYLAFPLVCLCGLLLIVDLNRPERFWHMMIQSQTGRPMLKWWSPMSIGSWGLSAFGAFSFA